VVSVQSTPASAGIRRHLVCAILGGPVIEHTDIGISTGAYAGLPLAAALAHIARLAPSAEIFSSGPHSLLERENARAVADVGLPFNVHGPFTHDGLGSPDELERQAAVRLHRRHMKVAARLGATLYIVHPDLRAQPGPRDPEIVDALERSFVDLRAIQDHLGLSVAVENMAESDCSHFCAPGELDLHGPGLVLDTGHAALTGTLGDWLAEPRATLLHVHLHDNLGLGEMDLHLPLGSGTIDVAPVIEVARAAGASMVFELTSETDVISSLEYLRARRLLTGNVAGVEP
jgi:sugar phosphate isomerase/epimerase